MQKRTESFVPAVDRLNPLGSWEAAVRWNALAFEWMAKSWQQWLELVGLWQAMDQPAATVVPAQAGTQEARAARTVKTEALDSRLRGNDRGQRGTRPMAKAASK